MLDFQIDMEKLFHKNQLFPRIKQEFLAEEGLEAYMVSKEIPIDFGYALLVQMVLRKRTTLEILVGILRRHFEGDCQATADALLKAVQADLVDYQMATKQFIVRFDITSDVQADLDRYQFPLPMVVEPKPVESNNDVGYYTSKGSIILKDNHHDKDVCLDHINKVNRTKLRLNMDVALTIKNKWRGIDKPHGDESYEEFQKRKKAFEKYDRTTHDVLDHIGLSNEGEFYLTHRYDKRGRTYCQGYHVNYQGATWNKAVVEFANAEVTD